MEYQEAEARAYLEKVCGRLQPRGVEPTYKVLVGGVATQVLQLAETVLADCIVVGTHSRRGIERLVLGSEAERIVYGAKLPVLIVPVGLTSCHLAIPQGGTGVQALRPSVRASRLRFRARPSRPSRGGAQSIRSGRIPAVERK